MRKLMGWILALVMLWGMAGAEDFGRSYREFNALYAENIVGRLGSASARVYRIATAFCQGEWHSGIVGRTHQQRR